MDFEHMFAGDFEAHLTVLLTTADESRLIDWAEANDMRYARIVLDRGAVADQPMLTFTRSGTFDESAQAVQEYSKALGAAGFPVTRAKIEASPFNRGVPQTADEAAALPSGCYFEHHVKLVLHDETDLSRVRKLAEPHAAHLSRNARRSADNGRHERFVTQRCRDIGLPEAGERLRVLLEVLQTAGFPAIEVEREFVVHDSHPALDAGWIVEQDAAAR
ncbi:hypothetical protein ACFQZZ_08035 [Nocardia sp. GCM10030253]|uniref:hypothetical protein n=1 Tax=Nocardia sp. GCM10030253 TaxID=3273404 RepID=UPI0036378DBE